MLAKIELVNGRTLVVKESFANIQDQVGAVLDVHLRSTGEVLRIKRTDMMLVSDVPDTVG